MKKFLLTVTLAATSIALAPSESNALWNSPQSSAGFGWLQGTALNCCPSMFFHGPLYNYGPYYGGYAYQYQYVQSPHCGAYVPAYPGVYAGMNNYMSTAQWNRGGKRPAQGAPQAMPQPPVESPAPPIAVETPSAIPTTTVDPDSDYYGNPTPSFFRTSRRVR